MIFELCTPDLGHGSQTRGSLAACGPEVFVQLTVSLKIIVETIVLCGIKQCFSTGGPRSSSQF